MEVTTTYLNNQVENVQYIHDISQLNQFYSDGNSNDQAIFAEMRSNVLLVAGEHYQKKDSSFFRRLRDTKDLSSEAKLRLTKNHTRKITQDYANNIMSTNPNVGFMPKNEQELHDQKVAELHHAVWRDAMDKYALGDEMDEWCDSFVEIGEVHVKIFWDPTKGHVTGFEPKMDEMGQPVIDPMSGQPQMDENKPIYSGEFVFEEVYGFNLLRPAEARSLREAEWLCVRKMANKENMLVTYKDQPEKLKFIKPTTNGTFLVFDATQGGYYKAENQVELREYYFRPSPKYPRGYFYITTQEGILEQGELPAGLFPICSQVFDKIRTTPRGRGPVKQIRPYQVEINRAASKMAEHQVTLGDDKLLIQNGTKVSAGVALPGIRSVNYTGAAPTILSGRSGEQYLNYMQSQITELYQVMNVLENGQDANTQLEPWLLLFRSAHQKKKFQRYIKRFEKFLCDVVKLYLKLAKYHLPDDALIYAIGSNERVNIPEFREHDDICYDVKVEAQADDVETKLGKQLTMNHVLQYVGNQLKPEDIGKFIREMPYANVDGAFDDFTMNFDIATNDILALNRGEKPPVNQYDDHGYMIKRLTKRIRSPDFKYLAPQIQRAYFAKVMLHEQFEARRMQELQRAEQGFIPTGGYLAKVDIYIPDPKNPTAQPRRLSMPSQSLEWLNQQLMTQGLNMQQLEEMGKFGQQGVAQQFLQMQGQGGPQNSPGQSPGMMRPPAPKQPAGMGV